ncbi:AsmA family protein [Methylobacter luteus]|uniref:AsmA family protein n=1 Tax=Methylobacter luteus TaxID=415 RepID=UPI000415E63B|nr:AsmA family protein [Methylobacter luteus]
MQQILKWVGITLLVLVVAIALFLAFFDWNKLRGPISSQVSSKLDRRFEIKGDLDVDLAWTPRITVNDIELANTDWGSKPEMMTLDRLQFSIRLLDLLKGDVVLPEIHLSKLDALLEKSAKGKGNWVFKTDKKDETDRTEIPKIDNLTLEDSKLVYRDPTTDTELNLTASAAGAAKEQGVRLQGRGRFEGERFTLKVQGGSLLELWEKSKPYPVDLKMAAGDTKVAVEGTFADPVQLQEPKLSIDLQGDTLAKLSPFIGVPLAETPPYKFTGHVTRSGEQWLINDLKGNMGSSDIAGHVAYSSPKDRPFLKADIKSKRLDFKDLVGFIGADPTPEEKEKPRIFPDKPYDPEAMRSADGDVSFYSDNIITPNLPVDEFKTRLQMDHGKLTLDPLNFRIDIGQITAVIQLDASKDIIATKADVKIRKVPLRRLLADTQFKEESDGMFFGQIILDTTGNSVADMLGRGNGDVTLLMEQGRISNLLIELAGLDVAESLGFLLTKDKSTRIRCIIGNFKVNQGIMKTAPFVIDTTDTNINIEGHIDLRQETANLRLKASPKDPSILSARVPVDVSGPLKSPKVMPDRTRLAIKGGASVALGVLLTPIAAIIPWIELGLGDDSACYAMINEAKSDDAPAPPKPATRKSPAKRNGK